MHRHRSDPEIRVTTRPTHSTRRESYEYRCWTLSLLRVSISHRLHPLFFAASGLAMLRAALITPKVRFEKLASVAQPGRRWRERCLLGPLVALPWTKFPTPTGVHGERLVVGQTQSRCWRRAKGGNRHFSPENKCPLRHHLKNFYRLKNNHRADLWVQFAIITSRARHPATLRRHTFSPNHGLVVGRLDAAGHCRC